MIRISCIIIEDEPLALQRAKGFIEQLDFLELKAMFNNPIEGMNYLQTNNIDLLFLDIKMNQLSGIQLLESINFEGNVIITTAYDQYALKGFELNVSDYLLKPYDFGRFIKAVDKVRATYLEKEPESNKAFLFVKTENRLERVQLDEIIYIEGMGDYRRIHTLHKRIMTLQTFTEFQELISPSVVCRVHKSYMVAIDKIDSIERNRIRIKELRIPISESYRAGFMKEIQSS